MTVSRKAKRRARSDQDLKAYVGLNKDGTVSGSEWLPLRREDQAFDDQTVCSDSCFWLKTNRGKSQPEWSTHELGILNELRIVQQYDLRGSCMLAEFRLMDKACVEVKRYSCIAR